MMTEEQALQQITACEVQITSTFGGLHRAAANLGPDAIKATNSSMMKKMIIPLVLILLGVAFASSYGVISLALILVGGISAYTIYDAGKAAKYRINKEQAKLNAVLSGIHQI